MLVLYSSPCKQKTRKASVGWAATGIAVDSGGCPTRQAFVQAAMPMVTCVGALCFAAAGDPMPPPVNAGLVLWRGLLVLHWCVRSYTPACVAGTGEMPR